jgi:hypothetical protein
MKTVIDTDSAPGRRSIDALLELYVSWREECDAVQEAYRCWAGSGRGRRRLAYAGYVSALDREDHAARAYAEHSDRLLVAGSTHPGLITGGHDDSCPANKGNVPCECWSSKTR